MVTDGRERIKIRDSDIQFFGMQLKRFVTVYRNNLYAESNDTLFRLNELDLIADMMLKKEYDRLFEKNIEIVYGDQWLLDPPF